MARPATARPISGVMHQHPALEYGRRNRPSQRMALPSGTASTPMTSAQPNSAAVGEPTWGKPGMASENVPSPVQASRPMKTSEPIPAASRPGTSTSSIMAPPSPEASISRNAPVSGEPSRVADGGEAARRGDHGLGPGRSVPLDQPDGDDARAPRRWRSAGPRGRGPRPGSGSRRRRARCRASSMGGGGPRARLEPVGGGVAARARAGSGWSGRPAPRPAPAAACGHHSGSAWKPRPLGRSVKTQPCILLTSARKK